MGNYKIAVGNPSFITTWYEKLSAEKAAGAEQRFITVWIYRDVGVSGARDVTGNPMTGDVDNSTFAWVAVDSTIFLQSIRVRVALW